MLQQISVDSLYARFSAGEIDSMQVLAELQRLNWEGDGVSQIRRIADKLEMFRRFPSGGEWLKLLMDNVLPAYKIYLVSNNLTASDFSYSDYMRMSLNSVQKLSEEFSSLIENESEFWQLVDLISAKFAESH